MLETNKERFKMADIWKKKVLFQRIFLTWLLSVNKDSGSIIVFHFLDVYKILKG